MAITDDASKPGVKNQATMRLEQIFRSCLRKLQTAEVYFRIDTPSWRARRLTGSFVISQSTVARGSIPDSDSKPHGLPKEGCRTPSKGSDLLRAFG